jgi:hypothetical protein
LVEEGGCAHLAREQLGVWLVQGVEHVVDGSCGLDFLYAYCA